MPSSPDGLKKTAGIVLLVGMLYALRSLKSKSVVIAREATKLSSSMPFLRAIEGIEKDGTTRQLVIIQRYHHHEEKEELLGGADNQQELLNELEIDDPPSDMTRLLYRQFVVATAMMIVGVNRVVVRDLESPVLYTSKRVTLIPPKVKFKVLIELAKKLNYEVSIK